jgi:hypothetical protein
MSHQSIFDRLRAMQTDGLPLHTLIVEACEVGNQLLAALESVADGFDPNTDGETWRAIFAAIDRARPDNGDTPTNGARAA